MGYLDQAKPLTPDSLARRNYEHALRTLKRCAMQVGEQPTPAHIEAAREATAALEVALTALMRAERIAGIEHASSRLLKIVEHQGGARARSLPMFQIDQLLRELFTATR